MVAVSKNTVIPVVINVNFSCTYWKSHLTTVFSACTLESLHSKLATQYSKSHWSNFGWVKGPIVLCHVPQWFLWAGHQPNSLEMRSHLKRLFVTAVHFMHWSWSCSSLHKRCMVRLAERWLCLLKQKCHLFGGQASWLIGWHMMVVGVLDGHGYRRSHNN